MTFDAMRRQFLEVVTGASVLAGASWFAKGAESTGEIPRRRLGRTDEMVSMIGLGGYHLVRPDLEEAESIRIVRTAVDHGINFLDNCWDYNGGQSELRMGKALRDGYRLLGKFKTPTLRNVDKRPRPDFVKAYMHNGYLKSLKEVVHFYNTRDVLPRCQAGDPGEKLTCWPAPGHPETMNRRQLGNLGLTGKQEDQIVAFLKTLTDGYAPAAK